MADGYQHACALTRTGGVRCWGYADHGQLGNGALGDTVYSTPVDVPGLTGVTALASTYNHVCALLSDTTVKCWGANDYGQLGDGSTTDRASPVVVTGLSGVVALTAGQTHTCAIIGGGQVRCWGNNSSDQLGSDGVSTSTAPIAPAVAISGATAISAGYSHTCAVVAGAVQCWGSNSYGNLGQGTDGFAVPDATDVNGLATGATAVSAGFDSTCAIVGGGVKCWGANDTGQLGNNVSGVSQEETAPVDVVGLSSGVTAVTMGAHFACAIVGSGVKCWGDGSDGVLGNGADDLHATPVAVSGLTSPASIANGFGACAVLPSGGVRCWGSNSGGQLGDGQDGTQGNENESNVPVSVLTFP